MQFSRRAKIGGGLLAVLLLANLITLWPSKKEVPASRPDGPPPVGPNGGPPVPSEEMRLQFQASLQKLPADQRKQVEDRMEADRAFFASVRELPEQERRQKMDEHRRENPPLQIPGFEFAGGPGGPRRNTNTESGGGEGRGPGGGPGKGQIPDPSVRRGMDQRIADSQRKGTAQ